jgi:hypothetical protein
VYPCVSVQPPPQRDKIERGSRGYMSKRRDAELSHVELWIARSRDLLTCWVRVLVLWTCSCCLRTKAIRLAVRCPGPGRHRSPRPHVAWTTAARRERGRVLERTRLLTFRLSGAPDGRAGRHGAAEPDQRPEVRRLLRHDRGGASATRGAPWPGPPRRRAGSAARCRARASRCSAPRCGRAGRGRRTRG